MMDQFYVSDHGTYKCLCLRVHGEALSYGEVIKFL